MDDLSKLREYVESLLPLAPEYAALRDTPHFRAFIVDLGVRLYEHGWKLGDFSYHQRVAEVCRAKGDECAAETGGNIPQQVRLAYETACHNTARRIATALGDPITEPATDCDGSPL